MKIDTDALRIEIDGLPHNDYREAALTQIEIIESHATAAQLWINESREQARREEEAAQRLADLRAAAQ